MSKKFKCLAYNWEYLGHGKKEGGSEEMWKSLSSEAVWREYEISAG